jgi:hypothetical protein
MKLKEKKMNALTTYAKSLLNCWKNCRAIYTSLKKVLLTTRALSQYESLKVPKVYNGKIHNIGNKGKELIGKGCKMAFWLFSMSR